MAVGFVAVNRALSNQLHALRETQIREHLLTIAQSTLVELEMRVQNESAPVVIEDVVLDAPYQDYQWSLNVDVDEGDLVAGVQVARVTLTVRPVEEEKPSFAVETIWPIEWVSDTWL